MKTLKQLLFAGTVMTCFAMTASAQKDGKDKPPPKPPPPIIVVQPKPTPDKPKKPEAYMLSFKEE